MAEKNHTERYILMNDYKLKIKIKSRKAIENMANNPFPTHTALNSVTDADYSFAIIRNKPDYLLQMRFDDISPEEIDDIPNHFTGLFSDAQAVEIAEFVKDILRNKAKILICQYEYGQSRSAGIAAAVRQYLYKDGIEIFADDRYFPNKLVYRKILNALISKSA